MFAPRSSRSPPCGLSAPPRMRVRNAQARSTRRAAARTASTICRAADCRARRIAVAGARLTVFALLGFLPPLRLPARVVTAIDPSKELSLLFISAARAPAASRQIVPKRRRQKNGPVGKPARSCSGTRSSGKWLLPNKTRSVEAAPGGWGAENRRCSIRIGSKRQRSARSQCFGADRCPRRDLNLTYSGIFRAANARNCLKTRRRSRTAGP